MNRKILTALLIFFSNTIFANTVFNEKNVSTTRLEVEIINHKKSSSSLTLLINKKPFDFTYQANKHKSINDIFIESKNKDSYLQATLGENSLFGQLHINNKHYQITTTKRGIQALDISGNNLQINDCGLKHVDSQTDFEHFNSIQEVQKQDAENVIDVFFLYSHGIRDRYPDELLETRLNQYINVANQSFANSNISLAVRKVGKELKNYKVSEDNIDLLQDMRTSLTGSPIIGMGNLALLKEQYGVDIFVYIRPHDILTRGNCGVAFYPVYDEDNNAFDSSYGVHVMSDGISSWSVCTDQLFIHELGHNLGAAHHNTPLDEAYIEGGRGFKKSGIFTTIMGSFGTGKPERFMEVDMFSNPNLKCAGIQCGYPSYNNANAINFLKDYVVDYSVALSSVAVDIVTGRSNKDSDNDGVNDWEDFLPFNSAEQLDSDLDKIGDNEDVFPENKLEWLDTDGDGIGNNLDTDDDNDGTLDENDDFPLDPNETQDTDSDRLGDNEDVFPLKRFLQFDFDLDSIPDSLDFDDDNDAFIEVSYNKQDLLVMSVGSNQILRFDAQTGDSKGIEVLSNDGLLTFQSDMAYRLNEHILFYTSSSGVKRLDLNSRKPLGEVIAPYASTDEHFYYRNFLDSGFPTALINREASSPVLFTSNMDETNLRVYGGVLPYFLFKSRYANKPINMIDLTSNNLNIYVLAQPNSLLKDVGNTFLQLNNSVPEWMDNPYAIALDDSSSTIFVSNQDSNIIGKVDSNTGEDLGVFANIADHGYSNPTGITLTGSYVLLVAAHDQNAILKYDPSTGEFLGELVSNQGINQPYRLEMVQQNIDRFRNDPNKVIRPNAGLWYNPLTSGRGFDIQVFGNRLSVIWYTFDENGLPIWYISSGELDGFEYTGIFNKTHLNADESFSLEEVGSITINFENERQAQVSWQIGENTGAEPIKWLTWSTQETLEENNYTGLWGRPDGPGWGVSVATIGTTSIAVPYIYDVMGEPRWLISDPVSTRSTLNFNMNAVFSDTLCPSCTGISEFTVQASGSMVISVDEDKSWDSEITYPAPLNGEWKLENTKIKLFSDQSTRPR